jgi:hypothetical protein
MQNHTLFRASRLLIPILLAASSALSAPEAQAAGEIRLIKASSKVTRDSGIAAPAPGDIDTVSEQAAYFRIRLRNIAFEKQVHVIVKSDTAWDTLAANWTRQADDDHEDWELKMTFTRRFGQPYGIRDLEFKLRYFVDSTFYWDDNGGSNYKLPRNGGTLLGRGTEVLVKNARWEMDTGAFSDTTVFTGEAEVRGFNANSGFRISWSTDRLKTQGLVPILEKPVPTWEDSAGLSDSDKVYLFRFRLTGIRIQSERNDFIHFHVTYWRDGVEYKDNNLGNRYVVGLGWALNHLEEEELPRPVALRRPAERGDKAAKHRNLRGGMSLFGSGRATDALGRSR